jgi:thioredoxin reductase (NADPH)
MPDASGGTADLPDDQDGRSASEARPRPAILTVDDDPNVSRAVAQDLRRKYGEQHRIVRADSDAAALDAPRQMKLRRPVALIMTDYRMPQMDSIEFLEQAMNIYPGARRALPTPYADTGAAIEAIDMVDLDYYLMKPWDPPEEKLYPVVDDLLQLWLASDHGPVPETPEPAASWLRTSSPLT